MITKTKLCKVCKAEIAKNANPCPHCGANQWSSFKKMTVCKTCGNNIARSANVCPHCGANQWSSFTKMTLCKTCGGKIAKSANVCPNCGAKQNVALIAVRVITVIVAMLLILAILSPLINSSGRNGNATQPSASVGTSAPPTTDAATETNTAPQAISITATDIWKAYSDNTVNADSLYKNKLIAVSGTISNIGQDLITKAPCVSINSGDAYGIYAVQCYFPKNGDQNDKIASLSDGDFITIYGTCQGTPILQVQLSNCYLPE